MFAALISGLAWISVIAFHEAALYVGGGWMLFGLVFYVVYRRCVEGTSLTERVTVPEVSLKKQAAEIEYSTILVPVFGTELDDDIVSHRGPAGRRRGGGGRGQPPRLDVIFVAELPLTVPIDAPLPKEVRERADRALGARGRGRGRVRERRGGDGASCGRARWARGSSRRRGSGGPR